MNNPTIDTFVKDVCQLPYGLIVVAGTKNSGKTSTMLVLEAAVSQMNSGRYFRIGNTPPEDTSIIRFIETFKPAFSSIEAMTDEEAQFEYKRYKTWERGVKFGIYPMEPAGVFIDDLDKSPGGLSSYAITMALVGILTIVSVEADSAKEAVRIIRESAQAESGPNSMLSHALTKIIIQKPSSEASSANFEVEIINIDDDFRKTL
jgi:hypothetical protein